MNPNEPDDFDQDFADATIQHSAAPAKKPSMGKNLSAAWNGSPLFKLFILVVVVGALAAAAIGIFSGNDEKNKQNGAVIAAGPGVSDVAGSRAAPAVIDATNDASRKREAEAIEKGISALPTPVAGGVNMATPNGDAEESQYDPLVEFRPAQVPETPQQNIQNQQQVQQQVENDSELISKMQAQMNGLFEGWRPEPIKVVQIADTSAAAANASAAAAAEANAAARTGKTLVSAGSIFYGQLLIEANSDVPGPIMAEIVSGPFTGGRAIGQFEVTHDYLVLHFTKIAYKKKDYTADIVAVDPSTTLGGLVTEKDNRYFTRVLLPSAAAFLEGFGNALGTANSSTTITGSGAVVVQQGKQGLQDGLYQGLGTAANTVGSFFRDEAANTKPLIRVAAGTPMGLFFVSAVVDPVATTGGANTGVVNAGGDAANANAALNAANALSASQSNAKAYNNNTALRSNGINGLNTGLTNGLTTGLTTGLANGGVTIIQNGRSQ